MILDKFKLDGKIALVTGSNQGIGQAYALALAEAGADIISVSYVDDFDETKKMVEGAGRKFYSYVSDFSDRKSLYNFIDLLNNDFANIDILVNNAGMILRKPIAEHPDEYWDKVIEVNLSAQFILTREIGKKMLEKGKGKIIFIASLLSFQGGVFVPGYAASKGGVKQLTMAFANEWAGKGINVNAIAPGYISTANTKPLIDDPIRNKAILDRIPAGRWGLPSDLAGTIVFLASEASDYINGSVITVDGGWMGR
jgi:2-deoxy-D-gluconate 3-dehydrogenase